MRNPLAQLCKHFKLSPEFIATEMKLQPAEIIALWSADPSPEVANFILNLRLLGARFEIAIGPPLRFWIANAAMDALITSNDWRKEVGRCHCPADNRQMLQIVRDLKKMGRTNEEIRCYLQRHFIPNGAGSIEWIRASVDLLTAKRSMPSVSRVRAFRGDDWRQPFRHFVVSHVLARLHPSDSGAAAKYGFEPVCGPERVTVTSSKPLPLCLRKWMEQSLGKLKWFGDQWGIGDYSVESVDELPHLVR